MNTESQQIAFYGDVLQKEKFVNIMKLAKKENRLISGNYWNRENCTGCLIGQITHNTSHAQFANDTQTPLWFSYLLDDVFENLLDGERQEFAVNIMEAIPVGFSNWKSYYHRFCVFILENICKDTDNPIVKKVIADIIILHKNEEEDGNKWLIVRSAASVVYTAASLVESTAYAAESTAWAAESTAYAAVSSAVNSAISSVANSIPRSVIYIRISKKLIELFEERY